MPEQAKPEPSIRMKRRKERQEFARKALTPRRVRVSPRDDEMRRLMKHPRAGGFRETGSAEWPLDTFTKRRIREGSVTLEESRAAPKAAAAPATPAASTR